MKKQLVAYRGTGRGLRQYLALLVIEVLKAEGGKSNE